MSGYRRSRGDRPRYGSSKVGAFGVIVALVATAVVSSTSGTASAIVAPPTPILVTGLGDGTGTCAVAQPTTTCTTLRAAVARASSVPGTTITVPAGVYSLTKGPIAVNGAGTKIVGAASPVGATPTLDQRGRQARLRRQREERHLQWRRDHQRQWRTDGRWRHRRQCDGHGLRVVRQHDLRERRQRRRWRRGLRDRAHRTIDVLRQLGGDQGRWHPRQWHRRGREQHVHRQLGGRGGAIAVWSLGKGAISYSTFVDNTSYGRLGGGVDRYSGSLVVTGSVLTASGATAKTGSDCSNGPKLVGLNFVGNATDCVLAGTPPLTATAPGPMTLGALANNGGPTQTIAPAGGSVGLDVNVTECKVVGTNGFLGAALTVDQRSLPRPSGRNVPPRCDLGAFETTPFDVELALSSSTPTPPVGASTIPAANIPGAVSETGALFKSSLGASPIRAFPLTSAPIQRLPDPRLPDPGLPDPRVLQRGGAHSGVPHSGVSHSGVPARHGAAVRPRAPDRRRMGAGAEGNAVRGGSAPGPDDVRPAVVARPESRASADAGEVRPDREHRLRRSRPRGHSDSSVPHGGVPPVVGTHPCVPDSGLRREQRRLVHPLPGLLREPRRDLERPVQRRRHPRQPRPRR